jgi:outer membrane immunogenic protein
VYTKAPPAVVGANNWSGLYFGGQVGFARLNSSLTFDNGFGTVETFGYNPHSAIGGGHIGVQGQWSNWVLGIEGTYNWTKLDQIDKSLLLNGRTRELKIDGIATVVGTIGYAWDHWKLYAKGGWAIGRIDTQTNSHTAPLISIGDATAWQSGFTVGGGLDWMFAPNFVLGVDFNYYNFGFDRTVPVPPYKTSFSDTNAHVYAATVRASYLLNWGR